MARPTKQGLDYFPMDCSPDGKLELFIAENGCEGFGLIVLLWQMIYKGEGYYITNDDDLILRLRKESLLPTETIVSIVKNSVNRGIFDVNSLENYGILTSSGIQKRFFSATEKRKEVSVIEEYLLIDVNDNKNLVFYGINSINSPGKYTKKSKEEESKEEESRGEKNNTPKPTAPEPTLPKSFLESPFREESYQFADDFRLITTNTIPFKRDEWAMVWDGLRRIDKRDNVDEMLEAIRWAREDTFWSTNFISPMKLRTRDKNGQLHIDRFIAEYRKSKNKNGNGKGKKRGGTPDEWQAAFDSL